MTSASEIGQEVAPIDFGIVLAWEPIVQSLLRGCGQEYGCADLLSLVHLSNEFSVPAKVRSSLPGRAHSAQRGAWCLAEFDLAQRGIERARDLR